MDRKVDFMLDDEFERTGRWWLRDRSHREYPMSKDNSCNETNRENWEEFRVADENYGFDDIHSPHHSMSENIDFFFDLEREGLFSFVFIANEKGASAPTYRFAGPDKIVGTALVAAALHGFPFCRPVGMEFFGHTREERCTIEEERNSQTQLVVQVHKRVQEMIIDNDDFVLVWHVSGDRTVHWQAGGAFVNTGHSKLSSYLLNSLRGILKAPVFAGPRG